MMDRICLEQQAQSSMLIFTSIDGKYNNIRTLNQFIKETISKTFNKTNYLRLFQI